MLMLRNLLTVQAADRYEKLDFKNDDDLYNRPAPEPWVSFVISGVFSLIAFGLFIRRVYHLQTKLSREGAKFGPGVLCRIWLSAFLDCNHNLFIICKTAGQSFWFLAGLQCDFKVALGVMLSYFAFESCLDALRLFIAMGEVSSVKNLVMVEIWRGHVKKSNNQLTPASVYEDLSRSPLIIMMVFFTQALLISFVVTDIFNNNTFQCPDGTENCPILGTLGSWCFYVLGVFMECVFLLGPKTSYGQSEQNPAFWLQLLLAAKRKGSTCTWTDPIEDRIVTRQLHRYDIPLWARFVLNFMINGIGYQILVHCLPIQVAAQNSLTGVVFRAVGMVYLVDLDDTPGCTLTLHSNEIPDPSVTLSPIEYGAGDYSTAPSTSPTANAVAGDWAEEAQTILTEAYAKMNALASRVPSAFSNLDIPSGNQSDPFAAAMFMAQASEVEESRDLGRSMTRGRSADC